MSEDTPTQFTGDLLVLTGRLAYVAVEADGVQWHISDEDDTRHALCGRRVTLGSTIVYHAQDDVCYDCRIALGFDATIGGRYLGSHTLLHNVTHPALPITPERANEQPTLWIVTIACDRCGTLLSVEGNEPETLGEAITVSRSLSEQHRAHHAPADDAQTDIEALWPDSTTGAVTRSIVEFMLATGAWDEIAKLVGDEEAARLKAQYEAQQEH